MSSRARRCQYMCHICLMARTDPSNNLAHHLFDAAEPYCCTREHTYGKGVQFSHPKDFRV
jgi:hypothetical protein